MTSFNPYIYLLHGRYYYSHFMDEETASQESGNLPKGTSKCQSQDESPDSTPPQTV